MRQFGIVVLVFVAVIVGLAGYGLQGSQGWFGHLLANRTKVASPLAACQPVTIDEASKIASQVVDGFNALDAKPFNRLMLWDIPFGQAIHDIALTNRQREDFITGARDMITETNSPAALTIASLKQRDRMHLVGVRDIDGQRHAQVRVLIGDGFNYMDLHIARTPDQRVGVVDFSDLMSGQPYSAQLTEIVLPMLAQELRTPLERLVAGRGEDLTVIGTQVPLINSLLQKGDAEQAHRVFLSLPAGFRDTKVGMMLLLRITQALGDKPYQQTMADIDRRFPDDPALGLALLDWHLLQGRYQKALHILDRIDAQVGDDPYLDNTRALTHLLAKDYTKAEKAAARACQAVPQLIEVWWTWVTVALRREDHAETVRLLDVIRTRFGVTFGDLTAIDEYATFVKSDEYRRWIARSGSPSP